MENIPKSYSVLTKDDFQNDPALRNSRRKKEVGGIETCQTCEAAMSRVHPMKRLMTEKARSVALRPTASMR